MATVTGTGSTQVSRALSPRRADRSGRDQPRRLKRLGRSRARRHVREWRDRLSGFSGAPHDTGPPPPFVGFPPGVLGMSKQNPGVIGSTDGSQPAIVGLGGKSIGVWGFSPSDSGVWGGSTASNGVSGEGLFGVRGTSKTKGGRSPTAGVLGEHTAGDIGVWGTATGGTGVVGDGALGGRFSGTQAPVRLVPSKSNGHPASGHHEMGELYADAVGELFYCVGAGTPGIWKMVKLV